jgi:hypothetical protein
VELAVVIVIPLVPPNNVLESTTVLPPPFVDKAM